MRYAIPKAQLLFAVLVLPIFSAGAWAQSSSPAGITFTKLDVPGALVTSPLGINNSGTIVGQFEDSSGVFHGFLADKEGNVTATIDFPGAVRTQAFGINERGDIVGSYETGDGINHGFILRDGNFITFDVPGAIGTFARDINDSGVVVGFYDDAQLFQHGYTLDKAGLHTIDDPAQGSLPSTELFAINNRGDILGDFDPDSFGIFRNAFLFSQGKFLPFSVPGETLGLFARGLSDNGEIAGSFFGQRFVQHGFLEAKGVITSFDFPDSLATAPLQMNASRHIVGIYADQAGNTRGFLISFDGQGGMNTAAAPASSVLATPRVTTDQVTVCGSLQGTTQNNIAIGPICHQ